jgi:transposase
MIAIGIDMSKLTFHAALDESTVCVFQNSDEGIASFIALLPNEQSEIAIGVEATGAYHLLLSARCRNAGLRILIINPLEAWRVMQAMSLRKLKTDRADALAIRRMVLQGLGRPYTETDDTLALKALMVDRIGLVAIRASLKQRYEARSTKQKAVGVTLHDGFAKLETSLAKEIKAIERQFLKYAPATQCLLRSIPGVGTFTAAMLVAFIGDINRFPSSEKLVAYLGLDCRVRESGTSVKGKGYITKRGNGHLRRALFNATFVARQRNPILKKYFDDKVAEGKHYLSAMCATERKLVHLIYAVWKRGTPFEMRYPQLPD